MSRIWPLIVLAVLGLAALAAAWAAVAPEGRRGAGGPAAFSGALRVIDGDTFDVGTVRVRLHGVDAVETGQTCRDAAGTSWACGVWVTEEVRAAFEGQPAACEPIELDRYGRTVAACAVNGADLGARLVAAGMALAYTDYSDRYVSQEATARAAGVGLWAGSFDRPEDWRAGRRGTAPPAGSADCRIKGNVSDGGAIYHVPGGAFYGRTQIDPARGERWFCTEAEARAAGWRAARR